MLTSATSRTPGTVAAYNRVVQTLRNHREGLAVLGELTEVAEENVALALTWDTLLPHVREATARQYRAALVQHIEDHPSQEVKDDAFAMSVLYPEMGPEEIEKQDWLAEQRKLNLIVKRGPEQRAKHVSAADWKLLIEALCASKSAVGNVAAFWMAAGRLTGLRPCEWEQAVRKGACLVLPNAKATHDRSHGLTRSMYLGGMDPMHIRIIDAHMQVMASVPPGQFDSLYHRVRDLIRDTTRRCLDERETYPCLYTPRHMFASAAKRSFTKIEVAALMGHASILTAAKHYAAARYASGGEALQIRASEEDMAAVRRRNDLDEPKPH